MVNLKEITLLDYENRLDQILKQSTFINNLQFELSQFSELKCLKEVKKQIVIEIEFENQLFMLAELRGQMDSFANSNESIQKLSSEIDNRFANYHEQEKKSRSALVSLLLRNFSEYLREKNNFSIALLNHRIPLQMAELNIEGDAKEQLDSCIQLIESHHPEDMVFKTALEIIKNSYLNEQELSQFIFIAHEEALSLIQKRIETNLLNLNIEKIKTDCEDHVLYLNFYRKNIINLVNYYQDYKDNLADIKNKIDFLETHVGDPLKDWFDYSRQRDNISSFLSMPTQKSLKSKCDALSQFKKQLKMDHPTEFLQEVKSKIQKFLDNEIEILNQQLQNYQTTLEEFASSFNLSQLERNKLLQTKQLQYSDIQKTWLERENRLKNVDELGQLEHFNKYFPKEKLFISDSLYFENTILHSAFLLLKEFDPPSQTAKLIEVLSKISAQDFTAKIFFSLENRDVKQLPHSINNLLQFINSESSNTIINDAKTYLANSLKSFFTSQTEKAAFCIVQTLDAQPLKLTVKAETYQNLLNYLHLFDLTELKKWLKSNLSLKEKIKEPYEDDIKSYQINKPIENLISTKELLSLFETSSSVWDACLLFQEFSENPCDQDKQAFPFLKETKDKMKFMLIFQGAVFELNYLIKRLKKIEKHTCPSTLFLKPDKAKQKLINTLITDLKNTPIAQADKEYINNFFATWKDNNMQTINEPRYRLLISLFMIFYRHIMQLFRHFRPSKFETRSHQTVNDLQKLFSAACEKLKELKSNFDPFDPAPNENQAAENLTQSSRSLN